MHSFHAVLASTIIDSGHRLARTIAYEAISQPSDRGGLGLVDIPSLAAELSCTFLQRCLASASFPCRILTLLSISDANNLLPTPAPAPLRQTREGLPPPTTLLPLGPMLIFGPPDSPPVSPKDSSFLIARGVPAFVVTGSNHLREAGWSLHPNPAFSPFSSLHPVEFLRPHMPSRSLDLLRPHLPSTLMEFFPPPFSRLFLPHVSHPSWCGRQLTDLCLVSPQHLQYAPAALHALSASLIPVFTAHLPTLAQPALRLALSHLTYALYPALSSLVASMRPLARWQAAIDPASATNSPPQAAVVPPNSVPLLLGTDGSVILDEGSKSRRASFAVVSPTETLAASRIPGLQTINRAELFGILTALRLAPPNAPLTVVSDSRTSLDSILRLLPLESLFLHRLHFENDSLVRACARAIAARGAPTHLQWVPSHTNAKDTLSSLNEAADAAARSVFDPSPLVAPLNPSMQQPQPDPLSLFLAPFEPQTQATLRALLLTVMEPDVPAPTSPFSESLDTMPLFFFLDPTLSFNEGSRPSSEFYSLFLSLRLRAMFPIPRGPANPPPPLPKRSLIHLGRLLDPPASFHSSQGMGALWPEASTRAFLPKRLSRFQSLFLFNTITSSLHTVQFYHKLHTRDKRPSLFPTDQCMLCGGPDTDLPQASSLLPPSPDSTGPRARKRPRRRVPSGPAYSRADVPDDTPCCICGDSSLRGKKNPFFICEVPDSDGQPCNKGFHHLCHPHSRGPIAQVAGQRAGRGRGRLRRPLPPPPGESDVVYCPTHHHLATRLVPLAPIPRAQLPLAADVPPPSPPTSDPPTASDPPTPSRPIDTCHHALIDCPHADLVSIRHNIFRSWAELILSFLPSDFVPANDMDLDPDALASSLYALHAPDPSCVLLPATIRDFLFSPVGPFQGSLPPRAVSSITARLQPILVKGLSHLWSTRQVLLRAAGWDNASRWIVYRSQAQHPATAPASNTPTVPDNALLHAPARGIG